MDDSLAGRLGDIESVRKNPRWTRTVWMRLGALNALFALSVLLFADRGPLSLQHAAMARFGAQVPFMHAMATLACATFMNIGARGARLAPAFFLSGILLYCMPIYCDVAGVAGLFPQTNPIGVSALIIGWLILVWSAGDIDKD